MKTRILKAVISLSAIIVVCASASAADQVKGAQKLVELQPIRTAEDVGAIGPGDMLVMACPKCKDVWVTYADTTAKGGQALVAKGTPTKTVVQHACPSCGATIEAKGHGKAKKEVITHICTKCGSKDAYCCVLKKEQVPTKGMEEKK